MELAEVFARVKRWKFTKDSYPEMPNDTHNSVLFAIDHVLKHMVKGNGVIATCLEKADHGHEIKSEDIQSMRIACIKQTVNALRCLALLSELPKQLTGGEVEQLELFVQRQFPQ